MPAYRAIPAKNGPGNTSTSSGDAEVHIVKHTTKERRRISKEDLRSEQVNKILYTWKTERPYQQKPEGSAELLGKTKQRELPALVSIREVSE